MNSKKTNESRTSLLNKKVEPEHKLASQINIIEQLNGQNIKWQNQEIEIERLQTTCNTLSSKVVLSSDLKTDIMALRN